MWVNDDWSWSNWSHVSPVIITEDSLLKICYSSLLGLSLCDNCTLTSIHFSVVTKHRLVFGQSCCTAHMCYVSLCKPIAMCVSWISRNNNCEPGERPKNISYSEWTAVISVCVLRFTHYLMVELYVLALNREVVSEWVKLLPAARNGYK